MRAHACVCVCVCVWVCVYHRLLLGQFLNNKVNWGQFVLLGTKAECPPHDSHAGRYSSDVHPSLGQPDTATPMEGRHIVWEVLIVFSSFQETNETVDHSWDWFL